MVTLETMTLMSNIPAAVGHLVLGAVQIVHVCP